MPIDRFGKKMQNPFPLHVVQILQSVDGGVWRHVNDLIQGMRENDVECSVIFSPAGCSESNIKQIYQSGASRCIAVPMQRLPGLRDVTAITKIASVLRKIPKPDLLHGHSSKGGALARLVSMVSRLPVVYTPHGLVTLNPKLGLLSRSVYSVAENVLGKLANRIIAVSEEEKEHAVGIGIASSKLEVIQNGISEEEWPNACEARRAMGVSDDEFVIGSIGRIAKQKAPENMLESFAALLPRAPKSILAMVGEGPDFEETQRKAKQLGIESKVRFLGFRPGTDVIRGFDVFALSSRYEGFPYVLIEALFAGLPIVTTNVGGASAMVTENENGFIVPVENTIEFARQIEVLYRDVDRRVSFGTASRLKSNAYTRQKMVDKTLSVYRETILGHRKNRI